MAYEDTRKTGTQQSVKKPHNLSLEGRKKLAVSGVEEVESFDDREIVMHTSMGTLTVEGEELTVGRLSVETGDVNVQGRIDALLWQETERGGRGLWGKLFH